MQPVWQFRYCQTKMVTLRFSKHCLNFTILPMPDWGSEIQILNLWKIIFRESTHFWRILVYKACMPLVSSSKPLKPKGIRLNPAIPLAFVQKTSWIAQNNTSLRSVSSLSAQFQRMTTASFRDAVLIVRSSFIRIFDSETNSDDRPFDSNELNVRDNKSSSVSYIVKSPSHSCSN